MRNYITILICLVGLSGCLDPYFPPLRPEAVNLLVVDGFLDTSDGTASVTLSRGVPLTEPNEFPSVKGAFVAVEDGYGNSYPLKEKDSGRYQVTGIPTSGNTNYRLHLFTSDHDEYYSDFVAPLATPEIDSITYATDSRMLTIRVNTHDDTNQARYFRWAFEETWNYHAAILSMFIVVAPGQLESRKYDEMIFYCWNTKPSHDILAFSSERLSRSIVSQFPVQYIPAGSIKLQMRYSILVKQTAISKDEYHYLEQLRKTTESIGGLFDPQPGSVTGNINREQKGSPVAVGYFSAGRSTEKRIYIDAFTLPKEFREIYPPAGCLQPDTVCGSPGNGCALSVSDLREGHMIGTAVTKGFTLTNALCADCRVQGGTTTPPDFWE